MMEQIVFEKLIHLLEISVVVGIGVIVYITRKYSKKINHNLEEKIHRVDQTPSSK